MTKVIVIDTSISYFVSKMFHKSLLILSMLLVIQFMFHHCALNASPRNYVANKYFSDSNLIYSRQYDFLNEKLKKFTTIKSKGGWVKIQAVKQNIKKGDTAEVITLIKKYLISTEDLLPGNTNKLFDDPLFEAIKKFQKRTGLKETGLLTKDVINEMKIPIEARIRQISFNMERCKNMPERINSDCIIINIPDFRLWVIENDTPAWSMKVVVGKSKTKTAVFNSNIKYIVFCPYWNVPKSILKKEILPALSKNPNYLKKHRMEWYGSGVRQLPGPSNSLGLIKFVFPNSYNIYLHDTPMKSLFGNQQRAFSHGCIRLEEPKKLALYLLRNDPEWNETKMNEAMSVGVEKYLTLKKQVQVVITYFTCWVDKDGQLQFRHDIYNRDVTYEKSKPIIDPKKK